MSNIEDLVRQSLQHRAEDVEPTPALWRDVDRRIAGRRRFQALVWSLAGATAIVATALVAPTLLSDAEPTPEVEPMDEAPADGSEADDTSGDGPSSADDEPAEPQDDAAPDPAPESDASLEGDTGTSDAPVLTEPLLVAFERSIDVVGPHGRTHVLTMDPEGESWIMGLAVRPGSTLDDYEAVVLTMAEGFWDLRHLHVVDGEVATWELFPEQYRPALSADAIMGAEVTGPVFSPDGDALAWVEATEPDARLRIVGWNDGPGAGQRATDDTEFSLGERPVPVLHDWVWTREASPDGSSAILATGSEPAPDTFHLPLVRQADGAWSQDPVSPPGGVVRDAAISGDGLTYALDGTFEGGSTRWMVRHEDGALVAYHDPYGDDVGRAPTTVPLPDELLEAGPTEVWVRAMGERALVGSLATDTAYLVDPTSRTASPVGPSIELAAPIR